MVRRGEPVIAVKPDHRVHKAPSDPKARRAKLAVKAQLGLRAHAAKPDCKAPLAHLGPSGLLAPKAMPGPPRPSVLLPERTRLPARTTSFWCRLCARLALPTAPSAPHSARQRLLCVCANNATPWLAAGRRVRNGGWQRLGSGSSGPRGTTQRL